MHEPAAGEPQADEQAVAKAIASMQAFDAMPQEWRAFCADYGRTARGESLARLLVESGGDVAHAKWQMSVLLPMATYAERAQAKPKRKRKAKT